MDNIDLYISINLQKEKRRRRRRSKELWKKRKKKKKNLEENIIPVDWVRT
jgi:hypothetical protein